MNIVELHKAARLADHAQHPSKWLAKLFESLDASARSSAQVRVSKQGNALRLGLAMKLLDSCQEAGKQHQKRGPNARLANRAMQLLIHATLRPREAKIERKEECQILKSRDI